MNRTEKKYLIYTAGYSCLTIDSFILTIKKYGITTVVDVRSIPYSQYKPEFNCEYLSDFLKKEKIRYVFLGDSCGARIDAPECYIRGKADYRLIAQHPLFQKGLSDIRTLLQTDTIVLLCAEKDPLSCHRTILLCRHLRSDNLQIEHLLCDGSVEDHETTEERVLKLHCLDQPDLFMTKNERLEKAYDLQGDTIAYTEDESSDESQLAGVDKHAEY